MSIDKCNGEEIMSNERPAVEVENENCKDETINYDSNLTEHTMTNVNETNFELSQESKTSSSDVEERPVSNGAVVTNGWPDIKNYSVEQIKENFENLEAKVSPELCISNSDRENLSLELHNEIESVTEDKALTETLVKEKKDSKVSRFVRMFNRKDAGATEGGERSSVRRNQSRMWGMCLQVQSPNVEDGDHIDFGYKRCEIPSIKSEPLIDSKYGDKESSLEFGSERGRTSSFDDIEVTGHQSLDYITCNLPEKKKDLKINTDKKTKSILRNTGGRRSFDKPQRSTKSLARRSNTLDDVDDTTKSYSRSSKTLPATPTSGVTGSGQDSNASHPFYKRFYSHCMILPMMKRKKETAKKSMEHKNSDIVIDTSPQSSAIIWQNGDDKDENVIAQLKEVHFAAAATKREEEVEDSPKKLPVIDDLLAEIMENVSIMEHEMNEDEKRRASIHSFLEGGVLHEDYGLNTGKNMETQPTERNHVQVTMEKGIRGSEGATEDDIDSWDEVFNTDIPHSRDPTDRTRITRSTSRVESLISKFEQKP